MWCSPRYPSEFSQETPDDKTRQQGNDGTTETGGRAEECSDHHKDDRRRVCLAPAFDDELTRPTHDAGCLNTGRHYEQTGDEDHGQVAEVVPSLGDCEDAREEEGERHSDRDDHRRKAIPAEQ